MWMRHDTPNIKEGLKMQDRLHIHEHSGFMRSRLSHPFVTLILSPESTAPEIPINPMAG